jgi:hypothetical protein
MFIHLDPRRADVLVPKGFMGQPQLVLQVGLNMAIPIPDLTIDEAGISCTLSFNRAPFWCRIPWPAIYALVGEDGRGGVWPEDVPPEIQQQKPSNAGKGGAGAQKKPRPRLTSVATAKDAPDASTDAERDEHAGAGAEASPPPRPESSPDDGIVEAEPRRVALAAVPRDASEPAPPVSLGEKGPAQPARQGPTQLTLAEAGKPGVGARSASAPTPTPTPTPTKGGGGGAPTPPAKDGQPARPAGSPGSGSASGSSGSAKKQKREIPPYLRVIK